MNISETEYQWTSKCTCKDVKVGTHKNEITVASPWGALVGIDRCVLPDVLSLWYDHRIPTIESCCGHGREIGYIAVDARYEEQMLSLGFKYNEGCFLDAKGNPRTTLQRRDLWAWPKGRDGDRALYGIPTTDMVFMKKLHNPRRLK